MPPRIEALLPTCLSLTHFAPSSILSMPENALQDTFLSPPLPFLACLSLNTPSDHSSPFNLFPALLQISALHRHQFHPQCSQWKAFSQSVSLQKRRTVSRLGPPDQQLTHVSLPVSHSRLSETLLQQSTAAFMFVLPLDFLPLSSHDVCLSFKIFTLITQCLLQLQWKISCHPLAILPGQ